MTRNERTERFAEVNRLCEKYHLSRVRIYQIAKKLGRIPTDEDMEQRAKCGRPCKY